MMKTVLLSMILLLVLAGCSGSILARPSPTPSFTATPLPSMTPTATVIPTTTNTPLPPEPSPTPAPAFNVCSPLDEVELDKIDDTIIIPFAPPPDLASDDPHQGVDFVKMIPGTQIAQDGETIDAALAGRVMMTVEDRYPYGNAVMVETPLQSIPPAWLEKVGLPGPGQQLYPFSVLTCPTDIPNPDWLDNQERSLYLLYAHLKEPAVVQPGEEVACGQKLGIMGSTGNSLYPHLHLEIRVGPAGASFDGMAHYTNSAKNNEMKNYCIWRVSDYFQLVDPMTILHASP
jgi:murein DD-endopeptidase MepM/ murein hydrolase activator NlpD